MKKAIISLAFIILVLNLNAQVIDYNLKDYKTPYYKRQILNFTFENNFDNKHYFEDDSSTLDLNLSNLRAVYNFNINSKKIKGGSSISVYENLSFNKNNYTSNFTNNSGLSTNNKYNFYVFKNFFISEELIINIFDYINNNTIKDYPDESFIVNSRNNNFSTSLYNWTGIGYGRIEKVEDARQTIYILTELQKEGRLNRVPTEEEITEISQIITKLKNERFFDSRLKKIKDLKTVDSTLSSMGLISDDDITYFTTLDDMWEYGCNQSRSSGYEVKLSFKHGTNFYNNSYYVKTQNNLDNSTTIIDTTYHTKDFKYDFEYFPRVSLVYSRPIKLNWQVNSGIIASGTAKRNTISYSDLNLYIYSSISYYPSTRTSLMLGVSTYQDYKYNTDNPSYSDNLSSFFECEYYFSPRLRLTANLDCSYNISKYNDLRKTLDLGFYTCLKYSIF